MGLLGNGKKPRKTRPFQAHNYSRSYSPFGRKCCRRSIGGVPWYSREGYFMVHCWPPIKRNDPVRFKRGCNCNPKGRRSIGKGSGGPVPYARARYRGIGTVSRRRPEGLRRGRPHRTAMDIAGWDRQAPRGPLCEHFQFRPDIPGRAWPWLLPRRERPGYNAQV